MREGEGSGQHGEDRILGMVFRDQPAGLVVDVGAADGWWNSNSVGLLRRPHWRGILIEPEATQFAKLKDRYRMEAHRVICIRCAIGPRPGMRQLFAGGQTSTFKQEVKRSAEVNHKVRYAIQRVHMVPLTKVLEDSVASPEPDFLSIDAEGMNYEVWTSLDQSRYRPKLVCLEGKGYVMDGYKELCRVGCNTFYLREDLCPKL